MKEQDRFPDWNRVNITIGKEARESLEEKRVVMIGLGSLGSEITKLLVMAGVGKFTLIDPDKIDSTNILRHVLGLSELGNYKVAGMQKYMKAEKNPAADVWAVVGRAEQQPVLITNGNLAIISGLGRETTESDVANTLRTLGITTIVAGVYPQGIGGEVFVIKPRIGPCFDCFSTYLHKTSDSGQREEPESCSQATNETVAFRALAIHINRIATIAADIALKTLLNQNTYPDSNKNFIVFANNRLLLGKKSSGEDFILEPLQSYWKLVSQNLECLTCNVPKFSGDITLNEILRDGFIENLEFKEKGGE